MASSISDPIADTRRWVERAVIGLNLCPFAKAAEAKGVVRYVASELEDEAALMELLRAELELLAAADPAEHETTLIVVTEILHDFLDFNDFLGEGDWLLERMGLEGEVQLASFHPDYQFEGTEPGDITNATNRSPWPTLHLLREDSIDRAVEAFPEAAEIYERNMEVLKELGPAGWEALGVGRGGKA
ncbi:MAG: DUF1415 domain-containing protein [Burkholderiaceae bacterium]